MNVTASFFGVQLPDWVIKQMVGVDPVLPAVEDRVRLANRLADHNHREGTGGPFAAVVADSASGEILSVGVNLVLASGLSGMHAEMVALSLAQVRVGSWDLGGPDSPATELTVSWRPCAMCFGAVLWSGVESLVIAGEGDEIEQLTGFDEGPLAADWKAQLNRRGIEVHTNVLRDEALSVLRAYGQRSDIVVYNARQRQAARGSAAASRR